MVPEHVWIDAGYMTDVVYAFKNNHWLDCLYNAAAAGYLAGVRLIGSEQKPPRPGRKRQPDMRRADGSPWIDREPFAEMRKRMGFG
jgi:hypothetical protein